jgi:hypothetical protein
MWSSTDVAQATCETINRLEETKLSSEDREAFIRAFDAEPTAALIDLMLLHGETIAAA